MGQNGTQTHTPDLNIVEAPATDQAYEIYDLLPKMEVIMVAVNHQQQTPGNNDVLIGVEDLLGEIHGDLVRIANKLEESQ